MVQTFDVDARQSYRRTFRGLLALSTRICRG